MAEMDENTSNRPLDDFEAFFYQLKEERKTLQIKETQNLLTLHEKRGPDSVDAGSSRVELERKAFPAQKLTAEGDEKEEDQKAAPSEDEAEEGKDKYPEEETQNEGEIPNLTGDMRFMK
jgi:hypothetical protein